MPTHQLPSDLRFPLHRDTPRKSRGRIVQPSKPLKLHDSFKDNRETRRHPVK